MMTYTKPTAIDSPEVGNLYVARTGKRRAWSVVRGLREQIRSAEIGHVHHLRIALAIAKSSHDEWVRFERAALSAIEARANELGLTTLKL